MSVIEIFWEEFFMVRNTVKNGQTGCSTVICTNEALLNAILPHGSFNLFKNVCERSWRYLQLIARKKDLISIYIGALLVNGKVNILVSSQRESLPFPNMSDIHTIPESTVTVEFSTG